MGSVRAFSGRALGARRTTAERPSSSSGRRSLERAHRGLLARPAGGAWPLGLGLAPVSPLVCVGDVGRAAARLGGQRGQRRFTGDDGQHHRPGTSLRCRPKRGAQNEALGRSGGGFTTKIYVRVNLHELPIGADLNRGEAHDVTHYDDLMDQRQNDAGLTLADKGYDSDVIRQDLRDHGAAPEIPTKRNRTIRHSVNERLYPLRARIECFIGHLKEQRRVATRYDKTASSFLDFVLLGSIRIWIRYVHRAWFGRSARQRYSAALRGRTAHAVWAYR